MAALAGVAPLQRSAAFHKGNMIARDFILALLTLTFVGCSTISVSSDASKWTIELSSSESLPSGPCRIYDEEDRVMLEGTLTSGKMDGTWTSFGSNGDRLAVWSYREGVRSGPVQMWYGPLAYPKGRGCRKLEGAFLDGDYEGTVTRYYPSGARQSLRVYQNKVLTSTQYWSPDGVEKSPASASAEAASELKADMTYLATLEDMVVRSLAQAHRKVRE